MHIFEKASRDTTQISLFFTMALTNSFGTLIFPFLRENVNLPKKIDKIFLKVSFIVALHVHFLLQIGIRMHT